jgi:DMSO reductase family type II enzyme molybdopterin subunit
MSGGLTRREFVRAAALAGAAGLCLRLERLGPGPAAAAAGPDYHDWRDLYRRRWTWERVVRGTHTNANCVSSCAWNLYVKDGIVWREEQAAPYRASNASVPDFNPRGCQKGACASDLFLGPSRVLHPLRRAGPRGSGRWKRVSWDEALDAIAAGLVDELAERGGKGALLELGPNLDYGPNSAAPLRFFRLLGAPATDSMAMIGDVAVGGTITLGTPHTDGTSDDWFRSDYLVLWCFNPSSTRIPDAHFLNEARYRGARVVCVAPDYNQSAIHADRWLPVNPGSDAALALAACQVILAEGLLAADYVREQTDLPFLVRVDDGRFLRESDLDPAGSAARFAVWDEATDRIAWAPGSEGDARRTLALEGVRPSLDATRKVALPDGRSVAVETVLVRLRRELDRAATPEHAARATGLAPDVIRAFAREFAGARAALILSQWGNCKNYHSDLVQRAQILLASLTGNIGRVGGGWRSGAFVALEGFALVAMLERLSLPSLLVTALRARFQPHAMTERFASGYVSSTLFHAVHGGLHENSARPGWEDPALGPEGSAPYLREALAKGHFPLGPGPDEPPPRAIVSIFGNVLRHARGYPKLRERLFERARLVVDVNFRVNETGRYADFVLPAAAWYEKIGIKYIASFVPYVTLADRAVAPRGEAKPEWEIFWRLAERVAARARALGLGPIASWRGESVDLGALGDAFSDAGRFGPNDEEAVLEFILSVSGVAGVDLATLRREAATRLESLGMPGGLAGFFADYSKDEPVVPMRDMLEKKQPYPTLTGRQQFYVDHPWFLRLGEALPVHKPPPAVGGAHPFTLTGGHTRWSIHSMWRDHALMLRLQRGEPVVYLNPRDCAERGIADHDRIELSNDLGAFVARAKISGSIRPGQAHIFHAWEPYQFAGGKSDHVTCPSPLKVTQLVGDYGHLHWDYAHYEPNQVDRDTRVDVRRLDGTT